MSRAEIADRLWGKEVFVDTEHGINTAIRKVRQALRDDPDQPRFVQTVTGRGYRFVGPVIHVQQAPAAILHQPVVQPDSAAPVPLPLAPIPEPSPLTGQNSGIPECSRLRPWLVFGSVAALLLIAVTIALRLHERTTHAAAPPIQSLAVLALENVSGDPN